VLVLGGLGLVLGGPGLALRLGLGDHATTSTIIVEANRA
jgi:hypothetical protein